MAWTRVNTKASWRGCILNLASTSISNYRAMNSFFLLAQTRSSMYDNHHLVESAHGNHAWHGMAKRHSYSSTGDRYKSFFLSVHDKPRNISIRCEEAPPMCSCNHSTKCASRTLSEKEQESRGKATQVGGEGDEA